MAFNLSALKALFSKLKPAAKAIAPMTDDIARLGANYGDDAARLVANYGDDAANAVVNYGDDALAIAGMADDLTPSMKLAKSNYSQLNGLDKRILDYGLSPGYSVNGRDIIRFTNRDLGIDGKLYHYPTGNGTVTDRTKARIMDNLSGLQPLLDSLNSNNRYPHEVPNSDFMQLLNMLAFKPSGVSSSIVGPDSSWLGTAYADPDGLTLHNVLTDREGFPTRTLVDNWAIVGDNSLLGERRPHLNTALGRWYTQALKNQHPLINNVSNINNLYPEFDDKFPF